VTLTQWQGEQDSLTPVDLDEAIRRADRVVLPGVGAFGAAVQALKDRGLTEPLIEGPATRVMSLRDGTKKMSKSDPSDLSRINLTDDADTVVASFGIASRICKNVVNKLREKGSKIGLFRPITLWPFPYDAVRKLTEHAKRFLVVELNTGQMIEDIRLGVEGRARVDFFGKVGGLLPTELETENALRNLMEEAIAA